MKRYCYSYVFILVLCFALLSACNANTDSSKKPPKAVKGVLDLTDWDFEKDGIVNLDGDWEFYWKQLLKPEDFNKNNPELNNFTYVYVPKSWHKYININGKKLYGDGYATYRLKILLSDKNKNELISFKFLTIGTAFSFYVNTKKITEVGHIGKTQDTSIPRYFPHTVSYISYVNEVDIVIMISNFHNKQGGFWETIQIGMEKQIKERWAKLISYDLFLFGSLFIMFIYHIGLFSLRKKDKSSLYFGILCLLISLRTITTNEMYLTHIYPDINFSLFVKIAYLTLYLGLTIFIMFIFQTTGLKPSPLGENLLMML